MEKSYINLKKTKSKNGEIEFEAEISTEALEKKSVEILAEIALDFELPGFRKGKVPVDVVRQNVDKMRIFEEAADAALNEAVHQIIVDQNLSVIGTPQISIIKMAPDNPFVFKIELALMPKISLPDYKKIGRAIVQREEKMEVSEAEVDEAIKNIQKMFANIKNPDKPAEPEKLPEVNEGFIKQFGPFKTVEEFRAEFKKQIAEDKKIKIREQKRDEIIREIVKNSKIEIPPLVLNQEFQKFVRERDASLKENKLTLEEYLKKTNKTKEALEKEMQTINEERLKTQLVMRAVQEKEGMKADNEEIHEKAEHLETHYPGQDHHYLHQMAEAMIINEKIFALFESDQK